MKSVYAGLALLWPALVPAGPLAPRAQGESVIVDFDVPASAAADVHVHVDVPLPVDTPVSHASDTSGPVVELLFCGTWDSFSQVAYYEHEDQAQGHPPDSFCKIKELEWYENDVHCKTNGATPHDIMIYSMSYNTRPGDDAGEAYLDGKRMECIKVMPHYFYGADPPKSPELTCKVSITCRPQPDEDADASALAPPAQAQPAARTVASTKGRVAAGLPRAELK